MSKEGIKISVDYYANRYTITGVYEGEKISISEPISGLNSALRYTKNYSKKVIDTRKENMLDAIEGYSKSHPNFKYSERLIKNVDPLVYAALRRWDKMCETNYAIHYLKNTLQTYNKNQFSKKTKNSFNENCNKARQRKLKKRKIDISYNVGLFNTSSKLSLIDKIRGIKLAKRQEKILGAKVKKSFIMEDRIKEQDEDTIENRPVLKPMSNFVRGHWTRRVQDTKDSILNKKFFKNKESERIVITGAATLLAASTLFLTVHVGAHNSNYTVPSTTQIMDTNMSENVASKLPSGTIKNNQSSNYEIKKLKKERPEVSQEKDLYKKSELENNVTQKSYEEKIEEFKDFTSEKYRNAFVIGKKPKDSNILDNESYSEKPDGSGNIGYFCNYPNYAISHINIIENNEFKTITLEGKSLEEVLNEHPDCVDYSIHFINSENGGGLGFVNKEQLEDIIQKQIDSITESRTSQIIENVYNDIER